MDTDKCKHTLVVAHAGTHTHAHTRHAYRYCQHNQSRGYLLVLVSETFNFIDASWCLSLLIIRRMLPCSPTPHIVTHARTHMHTRTQTHRHSRSSRRVLGFLAAADVWLCRATDGRDVRHMVSCSHEKRFNIRNEQWRLHVCRRVRAVRRDHSPTPPSRLLCPASQGRATPWTVYHRVT